MSASSKCRSSGIFDIASCAKQAFGGERIQSDILSSNIGILPDQVILMSMPCHTMGSQYQGVCLY